MNLKDLFKYIHFNRVMDKGKTSVWRCFNNSSLTCLGEIKWHPTWRQYCFFPSFDTVFSGGCLEDIQTFMKELRKYELEERKK